MFDLAEMRSDDRIGSVVVCSAVVAVLLYAAASALVGRPTRLFGAAVAAVSNETRGAVAVDDVVDILLRCPSPLTALACTGPSTLMLLGGCSSVPVCSLEARSLSSLKKDEFLVVV